MRKRECKTSTQRNLSDFMLLNLNERIWIDSRWIIANSKLSFVIYSPYPNHMLAINNSVSSIPSYSKYNLIGNWSHKLRLSEELSVWRWSPYVKWSFVWNSKRWSWARDWLNIVQIFNYLRYVGWWEITKSELAFIIQSSWEHLSILSQK